MKTNTFLSFALAAMTVLCISCSSQTTEEKSGTQTPVADSPSLVQEEPDSEPIFVEEAPMEETEDVPPQEIEFEGTLYMLYHNGEFGERLDTYPDSIAEHYALCFIIQSDKPINVAPHTEYWEDIAEWVDPYHDRFMIVPEFNFSGREFAAKYANKRVKVRGTFYDPMAGWRNVTEIIMSLKEIQVVE